MVSILPECGEAGAPALRLLSPRRAPGLNLDFRSRVMSTSPDGRDSNDATADRSRASDRGTRRHAQVEDDETREGHLRQHGRERVELVLELRGGTKPHE